MTNSSVLATITGAIDANEEIFRNEKATGTVTLAAVVANTFATGTVTLAAVLAGDTVTINGLVYTAVAGVKANNTQFSIDGTDAVDAADLEASIDADVRAGTIGDVSASVAGAVVTVTTNVAGAAGNATTLVSSNGTRLAVSGAGTLTGGVTADTVVLNGLTYTAVAGVKANNTQFSIDGTDAVDATDLADSITNDVRAGTTLDVVGVAVGAVVTVEETLGGTGGNAITLASSNGTRLALSGAVLTGGTSPTHAVDFSVDRSSKERQPQVLKVIIHAAEAATLSVAYDGTNYVTLGAALVANVPTTFIIPVNIGDVINFKSSINITLHKFTVIAIYDYSN